MKGFALFQAIQSRKGDDMSIINMVLAHPKIDIYNGVRLQKEAFQVKY